MAETKQNLKVFWLNQVKISENYIITSARSIAPFPPPSEFKILAGSTARNNYAPPAQEVQFIQAIVHDRYNPKTWTFDIAILVLNAPSDLSGDNAKSIGFYEGVDPIPSSEYLTGIGWRVVEDGTSFYPINLHAKLMLSYYTDHCMEPSSHLTASFTQIPCSAGLPLIRT